MKKECERVEVSKPEGGLESRRQRERERDERDARCERETETNAYTKNHLVSIFHTYDYKSRQ